LEQKLTRIWAEVLSIDHIGIHDNFFDLGGHSLAATRIVAQVIKQFQLQIPLQTLFQSPTIAEMATAMVDQPGNEVNENELDQILTELESLTNDEAQRMLAEDSE
jgi:acyl carrier protein